MEDISRELEKEIAQSKPTPYKQIRKKKILILDDFGEMKSGGYLKVLVYMFLVTSVICLLGAGGLYYYYSGLTTENKHLAQKLTRLEKKLGHMINEKEVLMAKLVIAGKELEIEAGPVKPEQPLAEESSKEKEKITGIKEKSGLETMSAVRESLPEPAADPVSTGPVPGSKDQQEETLIQKHNPTKEQNKVSVKPEVLGKKIVTIEKFIVNRERNGHLKIGFDIRNLSEKPGNVSGRVFAVLKPDNQSREKWLVLPSSPLEQGVPSLYKKGQYFSIAHFKPITFRIENQAETDLFKKAAIYIFNEEGNLMFEDLIDITQAESNR